MSDSSRPYKSHLFNFLNRQSLRLRDRLGETFRHLKVAAEWGAQWLIMPFAWVFHSQEWLGPVLPPGKDANPSMALPPAYRSEPSVDQPLAQVLSQVKPWFALTEHETTPLDQASQARQPLLKPAVASPFLVPEIVLSADFFEQVRQSLTPPRLTPASGDPLPALPASSSSSEARPFSHLAQQFKQVFGLTKTPKMVINGLACTLADRQLVLTTTENRILEVLSPTQQQTLQQAIAQALAHFSYERRLQWALTQKKIGLLPLVTAQAEQVLAENQETPFDPSFDPALAVIAPLNWVWRGLRWLEQNTYRWQFSATPMTAIAPLPPAPLWRQLDQTVAHLEDQEIQLAQQLRQTVNHQLTQLRPQPLLAASLGKTTQLIQQAKIPATITALTNAWQEKMPLAPFLATVNPLAKSETLTTTEPDPFQLQALIQAAIAYFFGSSAPSPLPTAQPSLEPEDDWLLLEDVFGPSGGTRRGQSLPGLTSSNRVVSSPANIVRTETVLISENQEDDYLPDSAINLDSPKTAPQPTKTTTQNAQNLVKKPWEVELEAAFDWIETEAKAIGYHQHPLEWILSHLDQLVLWLEEQLKRLWQWVYRLYSVNVKRT